MTVSDGRRRVVIEGVAPQIDGGRFPIKRVAGDAITVEADLFTDGHDAVNCRLLYRHEADGGWREAPMTLLGNDRWRGRFVATALGRYHYTVTGWVDHFLSWCHDLKRRVEAADITVAHQLGAGLLADAALRAEAEDARRLREWSGFLLSDAPMDAKQRLALSEPLMRLMDRYADRRLAAVYGPELTVVVDRALARFGAWYELFPRSCVQQSGAHGTFGDCEAALADVAAMGFDILYLPPIHPIGHTKRKGPNNALVAGPQDPGSPWAIGADAGGHKAVHPSLGTLEDFRRLVETARGLGLEVALDIAFQCSPDHPYVKEHPEWFRHRPDGSVQYAENPPKKYEDIYPFDFESEDWLGLWKELKSVFLFWVDRGVKVFRVDNPHTKPFAFWEWVIGEVKHEHPEVIFLAEAFARPKVMYRLAKLGFTQSYTYFAWRNTKWELTHYLTELTQTEVRERFRPNFWPNTPDILTEYLQFGGRSAFMTRLVLAATLSANYGIYGPAFELSENQSREPGGEEYLDSEKYQIRHWDRSRPDSLRDFVARVNRIRRENPALQQDWNLAFHNVDNDEIICYTKSSDDLDDVVLVIVNLDARHTQSGWVELPLEILGLDARHPYQMHDLLSGARFLWHGPRNFVQLDPAAVPAHIFRLRRKVRSERDFEYFF
ncbi:MAG: alpha-1,4-glucan--maltose-1-phosphate maltosyltransferase [Gammaproteobacteria bacterium]